MHTSKRILSVVATTAILATVTLGAATVARSPDLKLPLDPWLGLSESQKAAQVQTAYGEQAQFIRDFNKSGRDPHSLRREESEAFSAGPETLDDAMGASDIVVLAKVRELTFEPIEGQWLGQARTTIDVLYQFKGDTGATIEVIQPGSPAPTSDGSGVLQQVDVAPVLMPGDRVLLMLVRVGPTTFTPLPGAGVVYVESDQLRTVARSPLRLLLTGKSESEALALYSGSLARFK